ncbi:proline-rich transmembrane protein 3 [Astyanax mexicanus]|uniref:proline-rich transmembrane protein 3 n=1 Tax=Astyanax mexicanus TaxID=7994 RepID=UPI0020CADAA2|nr:proline-rich transmembrane protein 3 [Astyanax mexicanus]XP_049341859.1 proline-rich transmembrane protein 3 [Astyanax mexicanus]
MRDCSPSLSRLTSGRQNIATMPLLTLSLLLVLVQPVTSQVHVNSSLYDGNVSDTKQPNLGPFKPTGWMDNHETSSKEETAVDNKRINLSVSKQGDSVLNGHPEEHNLPTSMEEVKTELTTQSIFPKSRVSTKTQRPTMKRIITTTQTQQLGEHSEKATTKSPPANQSSDHSMVREGDAVAVEEPVMEEPIHEYSEEDVLIPSVISVVESSGETVERDGVESAQYRPQAQTAYSVLTTDSNAQKHPTVSSVSPPRPSSSALSSEKPATTSALNVETSRVTVSLPAVEKEAKASPTVSAGDQSQESSQSPSNSPSPRDSIPLHTGTTTNLQMITLLPTETPASSTNPQPRNTVQPSKASTSTKRQPKGTGSSTTSPQKPQTNIFKSLPPGSTTIPQSPTDTTTSPSKTLPPPKGRGRMVPIETEAANVGKELSLGYIPSVKPGSIPSTTYISKEPCDASLGPCGSPKDPNVLSELGAANGSLLVWADLSRTLSFAWELHVFGSAALFLLLTAGSALGLALSPSMHCPHRGALALANGLLLLAGAIRAAYFLLDPYGSRLLLPLPVVTALYTLPLPLLIWVQAAMVVLVIKGAEVALLPPSFQRPPLLGILAVLQCTLLLAADLLSPALSPAVPVVLQSLTLTAGLVLCLGYLFLVLPRLSSPQAGHVGDKGISGSKLRVLARVLAVCALLGALCCLLHAYTCLWLYGLLGDWRRFRWTWWLCQFWARLLELGWAFCLLLLASWVFWRPRGRQTRRASGQGGTSAGEAPSPCQSSSSSHTHTCWAKIVQSLKGRPHRKSDSNGVGGANGSGVAGELPNNWAGQERSGADISKSLIRNRDPPKESNRGRNQRSIAESSAGSLLRLQALGEARQCSVSGSLDRDKESAISLYDFDLRPPSPIDLSRSIDEALHREHLLRGGSLFRPLGLPSPPPSPGPWMRRNSDPQIMLSDSSDEHTMLTESSADLDRSIPSAVPSRQVTAPPTPTHQGPRWVSDVPVPSSMSCPVSLHPSPSAGRAATPSTDDTRPFLTPEMDIEGSRPDSRGGGRRYLKVNRQDDSASVSSDIIDL